jgi:hypothetical protein
VAKQALVVEIKSVGSLQVCLGLTFVSDAVIYYSFVQSGNLDGYDQKGC